VVRKVLSTTISRAHKATAFHYDDDLAQQPIAEPNIDIPSSPRISSCHLIHLPRQLWSSLWVLWLLQVQRGHVEHIDVRHVVGRRAGEVVAHSLGGREPEEPEGSDRQGSRMIH